MSTTILPLLFGAKSKLLTAQVSHTLVGLSQQPNMRAATLLLTCRASNRIKARATHLAGPVVVQVGEGHLVLSTDGAADDELVDVVKLIPILIARVHVAEHGLKLGTAGNAHVQALQDAGRKPKGVAACMGGHMNVGQQPN
eukprot:1160813-Pelagomonas_calceolata.AAC.17